MPNSLLLNLWVPIAPLGPMGKVPLAYTPEEDNSSPVGTTRGSGTTTPIRQGRPSVSPSNAQGRQYVPAAPASSSNPDCVKQRKRKGPKEKAKGGGSPGGRAAECPAAVDPVLKVETSQRTMVPCYTSSCTKEGSKSEQKVSHRLSFT